MRKETCSSCLNLKCRATVVNGVDEWLQSGKYLSHDIINELIEIMALNLLRSLLVEIHQCQWFALIADETRDQSGLEQLCISIRWVDESYTVSEDNIGMMEMQQTDTLTISNALKDVLLCCSLPLQQCRGQAYVTQYWKTILIAAFLSFELCT